MTADTDRTSTRPSPEGARAPAPRTPWWLAGLIGLGAALLGLLPWLATGGELPLQNLWDAAAAPERMPSALLPFSQYALVLVWALLVVGAGAAGIAGRALRLRGGRLAALVLALLVAQLVAIVQTAAAVQSGLQQSQLAILYLAAVVGAAAASWLVALGVVLLVARAPRAGAMLGLAIAALAAGPWVSQLLVPFGGDVGAVPNAIQGLVPLVRWVPPVLIGAAIGWAGIASVGRGIAAAVSLGLLWCVPPAITAVQTAAGTRAYARDPEALLGLAAEVLRASLADVAVQGPHLAVAVVVAAALLGARALLR